MTKSFTIADGTARHGTARHGTARHGTSPHTVNYQAEINPLPATLAEKIGYLRHIMLFYGRNVPFFDSKERAVVMLA